MSLSERDFVCRLAIAFRVAQSVFAQGFPPPLIFAPLRSLKRSSRVLARLLINVNAHVALR